MKISAIIERVRPAYLYHGTGMETLLFIIHSNSLDSGMRGQISFTRSLRVAKGFAQDRLSNDDWGGILVIDRQKLASRYRITPYNDFDDIEDAEQRYSESEEVVQGTIPNLDLYLVSILVNPEDIAQTWTNKTWIKAYSEHNNFNLRPWIRQALKNPFLNKPYLT